MADGHVLTFRGTDIHRGKDEPSTIHFDLVIGIDTQAEFRGEDRTMPEAHGQLFAQRQKHRRLIELVGFVRGDTSEDYRDLIDELHSIMDPTLDPGALIVGSDSAVYIGIPEGTTYTLDARYLNDIPGELKQQRIRTFSYQLVCIDSPPDWVLVES